MENGITKRQSAALQGVAVWMLLYHHMYSQVTEYESIFPFLQADAVRRIAWFCKICVGIFAFVSGYGMYYSMERMPRERFFGRMRAEYRAVSVRILKLYGKLWLVILLLMVYFLGILHSQVTAETLLGNLTALNPTFNGTWWYVEQYAKMLLLFPLLDLFLTHFDGPAETGKKRLFYSAAAAVCLAAVAAGYLWLPPLRNLLTAVEEGLRISFLLAFAVGYLTARYRLYGRADSLVRRAGGDAAAAGLAVVLTGAVIAFRTALAADPSYARVDFVLTPLLIYGVLTLLSYVRPLESFFVWWGGHSTYMWLVHTFVDVSGFRPYVRPDLLRYLLTLAISAAVAAALKTLESMPGKLLKRRRP